MFRPIAVAAALSLVAVAAAPAVAKSSQGESVTAGATSEKADKKICKRFDNTASRMKSEKLCLTREGWKKFERTQ